MSVIARYALLREVFLYQIRQHVVETIRVFRNVDAERAYAFIS